VDFALSDEEREVAALARRIIGDRVTPEALSRLEAADGARFDPTLWSELAAADLLGMGLPDNVGGTGLGLLAQALILEEVGRCLAPVPFLSSTVVAAAAISRFGTTAQQEEWGCAGTSGRAVLSAALVEPLNRTASAPTTTAHRTPQGWRLEGVKTCVPAATIADLFLVSALTEDTVGVFLIREAEPGLTIVAQQTASREPYGYLDLQSVTVPDSSLLGGDSGCGPDAVRYIHERAMVGLCATQLGVTAKALELTAAYTADRHQFERPIATFQAVGHRAADAYIDVEGIRLSMWQAVYLLEQEEDASLAVETAKWWAAEGGHRVAHAAVHLHGGVGVATDYGLHRYFAHAKQIEFSLGGATEQAIRVGSRLASA
jgi:acyl-CoA dehydrogenase